MKKRGFTLIELLAVIIILTVIALIATPIVLNVVENAKESARKSSVAGYSDAVKMAIYDYQFANNGTYPIVNKEWAESNVVTKGDKVTCEEVLYSNNYGVVLNTCIVGEVKENSKKYCFASGKTYENCEDEEFKAIYNSIEKDLKEELLKQYNASNTVGLLQGETGYYYKGTNAEVSNNYVWFAGHLWRVISIDNDNNLTMITQQPITAIQPASAVWTSKEEYEASYINTWLNNLETGVFLKSMEESDRNKILESTFNVGGLYNNTTKVVENIDNIQTTQKVGLLDEEQYKRAGSRNSFLDIKDYFWLGSRYNASYARIVNFDGNINNYGVVGTFGIRPVIKVSNLIFTEGEGTLESPFRENRTSTEKNKIKTNEVKVGEYISVPTSGTDCGSDNRCLFRVVSKDNDSIKVVLNGLLPSTSEFGSTTYGNDITINTKLEAFAETIGTPYRYTGNKAFGIGTYGNGANYTVVQIPTYTGNFGLPVVGEMFSGNDIDVTSSTKTFVNAATIENPIASDFLWTMNAFDASNVRIILNSGDLYYIGTNYLFGVRPVIFLNASSSLIFTEGEGTAENPFVLGN